MVISELLKATAKAIAQPVITALHSHVTNIQRRPLIYYKNLWKIPRYVTDSTFCSIQQVSIDYQNIDGFTALMWAIGNGYTKIARRLIDRGADINLRNNHGETALMFATYASNIEIVDLLIRSHVNLDTSNIWGNSALFVAIETDNLDIVKKLLTNGANPNLTNQYGDTPLKLALYKNNKDIVKMLLQSGANSNVHPQILHQVRSWGYKDVAHLISKHNRIVKVKNILQKSLQQSHIRSFPYAIDKNIIHDILSKKVKLSRQDLDNICIEGSYILTRQEHRLLTFSVAKYKRSLCRSKKILIHPLNKDLSSTISEYLTFKNIIEISSLNTYNKKPTSKMTQSTK